MFYIKVKVRKAPLKGGELIRGCIRVKVELDFPGCISMIGITGLTLGF